MAKEIAISKRIKISQAQQTMILSCLGASLILGVALAFTLNYVSQMGFYAGVIEAEDKSILSYSQTIENMGVCESPKGNVYTQDELKKCNPNSTDINSVTGSLRYNILHGLAANTNLGAVQRFNSSCINSSTNKGWTYEEMNKLIEEAEDDDELLLANNLMKTCSALRVISDALPDYKNEAALLSSLNKIFNISGVTPETISPADDTSSEDELDEENVVTLKENQVHFTLNDNVNNIYRVLVNIEKSIREFDPLLAKIEYQGQTLDFAFQAKAYYVEQAEISEKNVTINATKETKKK